MAFYQASDSVVIQAPPQRVYEALTHWHERMIWRKGLALEWEGEEKAVIGQKISARVQGFPAHVFEFQIIQLEPPYRIFMEYTGKPLKGRAGLEIIPDGSNSHLSFYWMKVEPVGFWCGLYFRLGLGLRAHRRETQESLRMLKEYLEKH